MKGFNLVELMIVIAIIGILAAIGLPAYQDYVITNGTPRTLTCYNAAYEVTYISPPDKRVSSSTEYGLWRFVGGGGYMQNSGETCLIEITPKAVEQE